jgi:hypothetical protein
MTDGEVKGIVPTGVGELWNPDAGGVRVPSIINPVPDGVRVTYEVDSSRSLLVLEEDEWEELQLALSEAQDNPLDLLILEVRAQLAWSPPSTLPATGRSEGVGPTGARTGVEAVREPRRGLSVDRGLSASDVQAAVTTTLVNYVREDMPVTTFMEMALAISEGIMNYVQK